MHCVCARVDANSARVSINRISTKISLLSSSKPNILARQQSQRRFQTTLSNHKSKYCISRLLNLPFRQQIVAGSKSLLVSRVSTEASAKGRLDNKNVEEQEQEHVTRLQNLFDANGLAMEVETIEMTEDNDMIIDENVLEVLKTKCSRVVGAGGVSSSSRVLVCVGNEVLADLLSLAAPNSVDIFHYSLQILSRIKEKHDKFRCWHGDLEAVLQDLQPYDVVFLNFFSAISFDDEAQLLQEIVGSCKPGAKVVISHIMGSNHLKSQREGGAYVLLRDLPDLAQLKLFCTSFHIELLNFYDEPNFYLVTLKVA